MNREDFYRAVSQCITLDYYNGWNAAVDKIFDELDKQNKVTPKKLYEFRTSVPEVTEVISEHIESRTNNKYEPWM